MRHNKKFNHLSRTASHRSAMLANMAISLIEHKRITTTVAKAKALKKYVEPLITKAKDDSTNSRRVVFSYLQNKEAIKELFGEVAQKVGDRPGGYTRIIKLGHRQGDAADICFIELVDFDENMAKAPKLPSAPVVVVARRLLPRLPRLRRQLLLRHLLLRKQRPNNPQGTFIISIIKNSHSPRVGIFFAFFLHCCFFCLSLQPKYHSLIYY